ncbi:unnamed protein product [Phytophthora fragariaefolia]|uniref:Unnamed protein product n=1 Tax=Phytophthora fragariaefolia TaxID=1490495 RepID=A0A9W7D2V5_9STRA|nr:unnamed protein product [Phytophthora fragariaefolia]
MLKSVQLPGAADGGSLKVPKRGSVILETRASGKKTNVKLFDVQYAESLERNIIPYSLLEKKGFRMEYRGPHRVIAATSDKGPCTTNQESGHSAGDVLLAALAEAQEGVGPDVQVGTLMQFHRRLGHLNYDTIVKIAKDPASGIALANHQRDNCLACAQGKQTKNAQSRKDTGANSPIDVIGGVVYSDLKGSRQFNYRIHVLRTDGEVGYKPLDLFCEQTGIARQISEPRNQANNGKAERMHRTIMNMVWSMVFACGLPLSFCGDAAYILNRSPSKGNLGFKSPMQTLTMRTPDISNIVAFGSPCTVHHDAKNKLLGEHGKPVMIIGKSDEMKGYRVYLLKDRAVVVAQHVRNVKTLMAIQIEQLRRIHLQDSGELKEEETGVATPDAVSLAEGGGTGEHQQQRGWGGPRRVNSHVLHTKWVFKTKTGADGAIENFKARPVPCGNEQLYGTDYNLTLAAVMELSTVKVILVFARRWRVPAWHGNIPNAYVKAKKEQHLEIYLAIPKGMIVPDEVLRACGVSSYKKLALRLEKSLYGLKQAGRLWCQLRHAKLVELAFARCITDMCLYYKLDGNDMAIVGVYVDDLLVTASTPDLVEDFFVAMNILPIKDLGKVNKFLGMRVHLDEADGDSLAQQAAIEELLEPLRLTDANGVKTPIGEESNDAKPLELQLLPSVATNSEPTIRVFQSLVGSLLWIARCTRLHISFAVESWSNADFAADKGDRMSVTGGAVTMDGTIVDWVCKKQTGVSLSTMEAEFTSASHVGRELLGLRELVRELHHAVSQSMSMHMDNQAAIKQMESEGSMSSAKHVDIRIKFICDYARKGIVETKYVESRLMKAELLTKAFPAPRMAELRQIFHLT